MLLVPALASALVFRNASDSYRTFAQHAEYLFEDPDRPEWFNLARRTVECTKFMMGFKVFSVLVHHGPAAWDENVTRLHDLAQYFARQIIESDAFELLTQPQSNIVCFRYINCPVDRVNDHNASIREYLLTEGRFYIVQTTIDGQLWLRVTIGSAHTGEHDLEALLKEIDAKFHSLACRRFDRH